MLLFARAPCKSTDQKPSGAIFGQSKRPVRQSIAAAAHEPASQAPKRQPNRASTLRLRGHRSDTSILRARGEALVSSAAQIGSQPPVQSALRSAAMRKHIYEQRIYVMHRASMRSAFMLCTEHLCATHLCATHLPHATRDGCTQRLHVDKLNFRLHFRTFIFTFVAKRYDWWLHFTTKGII